MGQYMVPSEAAGANCNAVVEARDYNTGSAPASSSLRVGSLFDVAGEDKEVRLSGESLGCRRVEIWPSRAHSGPASAQGEP